MSETLRIGIVGMTSDHVWGMAGRLAAIPGVELVTAADPHEELQQRAQQRYGLSNVYAEDSEMYAKEDVDAILVCSDKPPRQTSSRRRRPTACTSIRTSRCPLPLNRPTAWWPPRRTRASS